MSQYLNPLPQHLDVDGNPCAFYVVYFGLPNQDPIANPKAPYSDEALSIPLSTTQTLNNEGRYQQDIYLDGAYSIRIETPLGTLFGETPSFEGALKISDLEDYLQEGGSIGEFTVTDKINFDGAVGNDGTIGKNQGALRDELQIYANGDAFGAGSLGSGIHLYGNNDDEHAGNFIVLTGQDGQGQGRLGVAGGGFGRPLNDTRVTIGNGVFDFMDDEEDTAMLNLHNPDGNPAICFFDTDSITEGELAVPDGENFSIGHWNGTKTTGFTRRIGMDTAGNLELYSDNNISHISNIGTNDDDDREILEIRAKTTQTDGGWINLYGDSDANADEVLIGSGDSATAKIAVKTTGTEIDGIKLKGAANVDSTGSINSSTGITSVTRNGPGDYRVVLTSSLDVLNNAVITSSLSGSASIGYSLISISTIDIYTLNAGGTPSDADFTVKIEEIVF